MKKIAISILFIASISCQKKEEFTEYKIREVKSGSNLDCRITASSPGKNDIVYYGDCKTKVGSTLKVQMPWNTLAQAAQSLQRLEGQGDDRINT